MARLRSRKGFRGNPSTGFKIKARGIPFPPSGVAGNGMPPDPGQPDPGATPGSEGGLPNPSVTITPAESHLVKAGDTLWDIAQSHGTTVNDIMAKNQGQNAGYANISDMGLIYPGQRIFIRSAAFPAGATRSPSGDVGDQPVPDPDEDDPVPYWFNEDLYGDNLGAADVGDEDDPVPYWFNEDLYGDNLGAADVGDEDDPGATEEGDLGPGEDDSVVGGTDDPTDPDTGQRAGGGPTGGFASAQDFVDAQKAAGWQWYEDNVWKSGQAN
ncbi:MAG TPA: LysM domain-containing protein, partial [Dehalococcoidia bacterium]|nr:LysM domain-containing protein [Dehalococcoidia bacterium]